MDAYKPRLQAGMRMLWGLLHWQNPKICQEKSPTAHKSCCENVEDQAKLPTESGVD